MTKYEIIEDNAGIIHVFAQDADGNYIFASPVRPDDAMRCLRDLDDDLAGLDEDSTVAEIMEEMSIDDAVTARKIYYEDLTSREHGWSLITSASISSGHYGYAGRHALNIA